MKLGPLNVTLAKAASPALPSGGSAWSSWNPVRPYRWGSSTDTVQNNSIVEAVLSWICRTFPEAPVQVRMPNKQGDMEPVRNHEMTRLIRRPTPYYSGVIAQMAMLVDWYVDGNAYQLKLRNGQKKPIWLPYVPYWMMEPKGEDRGATIDTFITHYEYSPYSGSKFRVEAEDVLHFRHGIDPDNPRKGKGKFKTLLREIMTDAEAANFTASLLHNMGVPGLVISPSKESTDYEISPEEAEATKDYVKENLTGDNRGSAMVFRGPVTMSQFGFNPDEMNLRDLRKIPEERISGVVGIAAIVAGLGAGLDRSTFANFEEARQAAYEENIIPTQRIFAADYEIQLVPDFEPNPDIVEVYYDTSGVRVLQEDKNKESERLAKQYDSGIILRSEARSKLGYDAVTADEVFKSSLSVEYVTRDNVPLAEPILDAPKSGTKGASRNSARLIANMERRTSKVTKRFQSELAEGYRSIATVASHLLPSDAGKSFKKPNDEPAIIDDIVAAMMDSSEMEAAIQAEADALGGKYRKAYSAIGETVFSEISSFLGIDVAWDLEDVGARHVLETGGKRIKLVDLPAGVEADIRAAVARGRAAGSGTDVIARDIREHVGQTRAETIARTEAKYAQNISSMEAYKKSEVVTALRAFDNQTGYDDDDCVARDGGVFSFEEAARITEDEHPRGTLSWAPVVGD